MVKRTRRRRRRSRRQRGGSVPIKFGVLGIFKNEALAIREWIEHYQWQGADVIVLLNNNSTDDWKEKVHGLKDVYIVDAPKAHAQAENYADIGMPIIREKGVNVMTIVDLDEFMFGADGMTLKEQLVNIFGGKERPSQFSCMWKMFGSSGHEKQPASIRESFTKAKKGLAGNVKSVVWVDDIIDFTGQVQGEMLPFYKGISIHNFYVGSKPKIECPPGIQLNHYAIQSREYFEQSKMKRGNASGKDFNTIRTWNYFKGYNHAEEDNNTLKELLKRRGHSRRQRGGNKKAVVFTLTHGAGFGSVFFYMLQAYIYAKKGGHEFRVKNENWQYGPEKGWHDFFTTLKAYNPAEKMEEENFKHAQGPRDNYTLGEYHEAIKEVYKPKQDILEAAEEFKKKIGGSYKSVFVRRGDKTSGGGKEMDAADLQSLTKDMGIKEGNLFVMSDDYAVVKEIKGLLPAVKVFTLTEPGAKGFSIHRIQSEGAEVRKKEARELFTSVEVFHGGEKGWADNRSNLGRFLKMRDLEKVVLYPPEGDIPLEKIIHPSSDYLRP